MTGAPAVVRFSRDRRGYENFYLVQGGGRGAPRILYWYRTPPGIKVGRPPFDAVMQRQIEAQYPDVFFDWPRIVATPIPPPAADVERWRERRQAERAEKAARAARRTETEGASESSGEMSDDGELEAPDQQEAISAGGDAAASDHEMGRSPASAPESAQPTGGATPVSASARRRRRRRKRRGGGGATAAAPVADEPGDRK